MKFVHFLIFNTIFFSVFSLSANILNNGGFENDLTNWSICHTSADITVVTDAVIAASGTKSAKVQVVTSTANPLTSNLTFFMNFQKGATYKVRFKAKASSNTTLSVYINQLYIAGTIMTSSASLTTNFQEFEFVSTTPIANSNHLGSLMFGYAGVNSGTTIWIDDVEVCITSGVGFYNSVPNSELDEAILSRDWETLNVGNDGTFVVDNTSQLSGVNSYRIIRNNVVGDWTNFQLYTWLCLQAGSTYKISFDAVGSINNMRVGLFLDYQTPNWTGYNSFSIIQSTKSTYTHYINDWPSENVFVNPSVLRFMDFTVGTTWIDNIKIVPYHIALSSTTINSNSPSGTVVGALLPITDESNVTYTLSLPDMSADATYSNSLFISDGVNLSCNGSMTTGNKKVRIGITDNNGGYVAKDIIITVHDVTTDVNVSVTNNQTESVLTSVNDNVTISGIGTTLSIGANKTVNSVTVNAGAKLNFTGSNTLTITNDLLLKSDVSTSFSANIGSGTLAVGGAIKYLKTINNSNWFFLSFPSDVSIAQISATNTTLGVLGTDWFIKYYDGTKRGASGAGSNWISITNADLVANPAIKLNRNQGYIFGLKNGKPDTELSFLLDKGVLSNEYARSITVNENAGAASVNNHGWNLIGQPYLSTYNSQSGSSLLNMYVFNGSTYDFYAQNTLDLPQVEPFAAFFTQVDAALSATGASFGLSARQSVRSLACSNESDLIRVYISTATGSDKTNLILDDEQSVKYQIGRDLEKILNTSSNLPQIFTVLDNINYANNALPDDSVQNLQLAYYSNSDSRATISVDVSNANGLPSLLLIDKERGIETNLITSNYSFDTHVGVNSNRFLLKVPKTEISTSLQAVGIDANFPVISQTCGKLILQNLIGLNTIRIFDALGCLFLNKSTTDYKVEIQLPLRGIYIVDIQSGVNHWIKRIVN